MKRMYPNFLEESPPISKRQWMLNHIAAAFGALWSSGFGVDWKDEEEAKKEIEKLIREYGEME